MSRGRRIAAGLALVAAGCGAGPSGVAAEPSELIFTPDREALELTLRNHGAAPVPLARVRLDPRDPDWGAFVVVDRELPREIAAGGAVSLHLRVDREHFAPRGGPERQGLSHLLFQTGAEQAAVTLRYQPEDPARTRGGVLARVGVLLVGVGLALALARRRRWPAWTTWLPLLTLVCVAPWGPALCPTRLGSALSAADLGQCADRRGGLPLQLVPAAESGLLYLVTLVLAALGRLSEPSGGRRLASRDLALAAAFSVPLWTFGTLDLGALTSAQATPWTLLAWVPRWGSLVQPLAALLAFALVVARPGGALDRLHVALALALFFFGGAATPSFFHGAHAVALGLAGAALVAKVAALAWVLRRVAQAPGGSRVRTWAGGIASAGLPLLVLSVLWAGLAAAAWR